MPFSKWIDACRNRIATIDDSKTKMMLEAMFEKSPYGKPWIELYWCHYDFCCANARMICENHGIKLPSLADEALWNVYLKHFRETGFVEC